MAQSFAMWHIIFATTVSAKRRQISAAVITAFCASSSCLGYANDLKRKRLLIPPRHSATNIKSHDCRTQSYTTFGSRTCREHQRKNPEDKSERSHQDRSQAYFAELELEEVNLLLSEKQQFSIDNNLNSEGSTYDFKIYEITIAYSM